MSKNYCLYQSKFLINIKLLELKKMLILSPAETCYFKIYSQLSRHCTARGSSTELVRVYPTKVMAHKFVLFTVGTPEVKIKHTYFKIGGYLEAKTIQIILVIPMNLAMTSSPTILIHCLPQVNGMVRLSPHGTFTHPLKDF